MLNYKFMAFSSTYQNHWHEALLYKLQNNEKYGNLLYLNKFFLHNILQNVVLNGQSSIWKSITAGVPQNSVLCPLFFLVYVNNLPQELMFDVKVFADGNLLFSDVNCVSTSSSTLNNNLMVIQGWANNQKISFNHDKNKRA